VYISINMYIYIHTYVYFTILQYNACFRETHKTSVKSIATSLFSVFTSCWLKIHVLNVQALTESNEGSALETVRRDWSCPLISLTPTEKMPTTLWYFNIAIENGPFTVDFAIQMGMFQFAMLGYQRVPFTIFPWPNEENPPSAPQTSDLHQQN